MASDFPKSIGNPARSALEHAGYTRLEQLAGVSERELAALHGVGPKALAVLKDALAARGLSLGGSSSGVTVERRDLEAHLASFAGAGASYPFGPDYLVYKVRGKMFALVDQGEPSSVTLKCAPEDGELLVSQFAAVKPGYHMNKRHWLTITLAGDVTEAMLAGLAGDSYALVVKGLPKAVRDELERG